MSTETSPSASEEPAIRALSCEHWAMVLGAMPTVEYIAGRRACRCGRVFTRRDLKAIGNLAIVELALTYQPGARSFASYVQTRVEGAMRDAVKRERPAWLHAREAQRAVRDYVRSFEEREPDDDADPAWELQVFAAGVCMSMFSAIVAGAILPTETLIAEADTLRRANEALQRAMESLDPVERGLVELRAMKGLDLSDAAAALGLTARTARRRYGEAMDRLAIEIRSRVDSFSKQPEGSNR